MNELQQLKAMLERSNIGHGLRIDYNPPGTAVLVESESFGKLTIAEFRFDESGMLKTVNCYEEEGVEG